MSRPVVFGVLNVTPDSFSDGGRYLDPERAVEHGRRLVADGADVLDVGGESTRPGSSPVPVDEETRRVLPVVERLAAEGVPVSVDTRSADVAGAAIAAGARFINDVSGGTYDRAMLSTVADADVDLVVMHSRGPSGAPAEYTHVVRDVAAELEQRVAAALDAGVPGERIVIDPGLGFAKRGADNWALLAHLTQVALPGFRMLVGASRKRFLTPYTAPGGADPRDLPTAVLSALLARAGVWGVRVHDVAATRAALGVAAAWTEAEARA